MIADIDKKAVIQDQPPNDRQDKRRTHGPKHAPWRKQGCPLREQHNGRHGCDQGHHDEIDRCNQVKAGGVDQIEGGQPHEKEKQGFAAATIEGPIPKPDKTQG